MSQASVEAEEQGVPRERDPGRALQARRPRTELRAFGGTGSRGRVAGMSVVKWTRRGQGGLICTAHLVSRRALGSSLS